MVAAPASESAALSDIGSTLTDWTRTPLRERAFRLQLDVTVSIEADLSLWEVWCAKETRQELRLAGPVREPRASPGPEACAINTHPKRSASAVCQVRTQGRQDLTVPQFRPGGQACSGCNASL